MILMAMRWWWGWGYTSPKEVSLVDIREATEKLAMHLLEKNKIKRKQPLMIVP